jgi:hypothetical protein
MKQIAFLFAFLLTTIAAFAQSKTRYVTATGLNLRETESVTSKVVLSLKQGDAVELLGYKSAPTVVNGNSGSWVQVSARGKRGYVFDFHLSETKSNGATTKPNTNVVTPSVKPTAKATATTFPANFKPTKSYNRDRADLHEYLKIQPLGNGLIAYEIYMVNGGCDEFKFRGVATLNKSDLGGESDTDDKGNGYSVDEYFDSKNGKCGVSIRIGADKGYTKYARFHLFDCDKTPHCKEKTDSETLISDK